MPVRKLRTLEEAERSLWMAPDDPRLWATIEEVWATAEALAPRRFVPGVRRFTSIEAKNAARDEQDATFARTRATSSA